LGRLHHPETTEVEEDVPSERLIEIIALQRSEVVGKRGCFPRGCGFDETVLAGSLEWQGGLPPGRGLLVRLDSDRLTGCCFLHSRLVATVRDDGIYERRQVYEIGSELRTNGYIAWLSHLSA